MIGNISDRLTDQRLRNRMSEVVLMLVDWKDTFSTIGPSEYFNAFFDWFPDGPPLPSNSALTDSERDALTAVLSVMSEAVGSKPNDVTAEQLIARGWPQRIAVDAKRAYELLLARGLFLEDQEEEEPSRFADS